MVEESTRRLPNWMLGITVGAGGTVASDGDHDDGDSSSNQKKKKKLRRSDITESKEENANLTTNSIGEKEILTRNPKCETRRRKRNRIENGDIENSPNKRKNNPVKRNQKAKSDKKEKWINGSSSCVENDDDDIEEEEELTVEDLVRIAEEYVKADEDSRKTQLLSRECESQSQIPTKVYSSSGLEVIPNNVNASYSSMESLDDEQRLISGSRMGDPAQDMLDLFLGPLLKKPIEKEKRSEFVTKDLDFVMYKLESGSQNDVGGELVLPMKKKSSLRDKVSVLLD